MNARTGRALLASSVILSASLLTQPVFAQATTDASSNADIIVTARKRAESIMNVPVVATALSQQEIDALQTDDLRALSSQVPGLTLGGSLLSVGVQASIRGVGTSSLDPGVDSSVALNIDGLPLSQGLAFASGMFDVAQIEVLKGPQSLFFGKSAPAGVISLRTADPTDRFELMLRGGYEFEANEARVEGIVSGPVSDTLGLRVAATYGELDGFYHNNATPVPELGALPPASNRQQDGHDFKIRATALWNPTDAFEARLKVNYTHERTLYGTAVQNVLCPDGTGAIDGRKFINDDCKRDRYAGLVDLNPEAFPGIPNNGTPYNDTDQVFGSLELNYEISPQLSFTSATGYYRVKADSMVNAAMSSAGAGLISAINDFEREQFTQELRLLSNFSGPLNFLVVGFLERGSFSDLVTIGGNTFLGTPPILQTGKKSVDISTNSLFGQLLYDVTPQLEVALGARWSDETRKAEGVNLITGSPVPVALAVPKINANNVAPEFTVTYRPNDDLTIFGALKRGYKSGSFNVSTPPFTGEDNSFGDEKVDGGEVGIKSRFMDRQLMFNLAGFYYEYSGLQVGANVPNETGVPVTRTVNAGAARIYGLEAEASYSPDAVPGLSVRASLNWNNAKYTKLTNVPCYGGQRVQDGCDLQLNPGTGAYTAQDRSGEPLLRAPRWQGNLGLNYELPVGTDMRLNLASNMLFSSRYLANLGYPYYQPSFVKADATLALSGPSDRWELALIGRNLNNALTSGNCANSNRQNGQTGGQATGTTGFGPAGIDEIGCYMDRGREVWLRLTLRPFN
jgi:iron complex outermembrane receptor protein